MNDSEKEKAHETHARWQNIALTQLGYSINLILAFSLTTIGFGVSSSSGAEKFSFNFFVSICFVVALILLSLSIVFGLICTITRLYDFRKTREIAKLKCRNYTSLNTWRQIGKLKKSAHNLGKHTWRIFKWQLGSFGVGFICLAISIAVPIFPGSVVEAAQVVIAHCSSFHTIFQ